MSDQDPTRAFEGRRILVVEDQYFLANDLAQALAGEGAVVVGPVPDAALALELAGAEDIDGAVLDIDLGGIMADGIAAELRRRNVPFLLASGYDGNSLPDELKSSALVSKPFEMRELLGQLRRVIG